MSDDIPKIMSESSKLVAEARGVLLARLESLLDQSGELSESLDLEAWLDAWLCERLPELGGSTPAEIMISSRGLDELTVLLERMRGGLAA